tara:strand:- start:26 stop:412 length:387 start_codon:yes stop_codon:yes gene_type:complete
MKRFILPLLIALALPINVHAQKPPGVTTTSSPSSISLAKHLKSTGAVKYSAYWCPHCHEQNELFGKKAAAILLNVECAEDGENSNPKLCQRKGINSFPSWEINGVIESGVKTLDELSELSDFQGSKDF